DKSPLYRIQRFIKLLKARIAVVDVIRIGVVLYSVACIVTKCFRPAGDHPVRLELIERVVREEFLVAAIGVINFGDAVASIALNRGKMIAFILDSMEVIVVCVGVIDCSTRGW